MQRKQLSRLSQPPNKPGVFLLPLTRIPFYAIIIRSFVTRSIMQTIANPLMPGVIDLKMWIGENNYSVGDATREYERMGFSKRLPLKSIPDGILPGVSRFFAAHRRAIINVTVDDKSLKDLVERMQELSLLGETKGIVEITDEIKNWNPPEELLPSDMVPEGMLQLVMAYEQASGKDRAALQQEFKIKRTPGIFGWSYITNLRYVCKEDEDELPEGLQNIAFLEPVKVVYKGKKDD